MSIFRGTILLLMLAVLGGCKSSEVIGGSSRQSAGQVDMTIITTPDGWEVTINDSRESLATTQPSVTVNGSSATPRIGATTQPGDFGSISYDFPPQIRRTFADKNAKWLACIFGICAIACFVMRKPIYGIMCVAIGIISALHPMALVIGMFVVLGMTLFLGWKNIKQLGKGIVKAEQQTPPDVNVAAIVREEVDQSTQKMAGIENLGPATGIPPK